MAAAVHDQAQRTPTAVALRDDGHSLDYATVDALGAMVAQTLADNGIRPGDAVAVALPRGWRLVCVMLGILRLGAKVVPLDRQSPPERRRHILSDSGAVAVVHDDGVELPESILSLPVSVLLTGERVVAGRPGAPGRSSFLFYTSGTTGLPKGVEAPDAGILRLARPGYIPIAPGTRYACLSNPAFDALSFEVWVPLVTGGCCVIIDDETAQTPHELAAALRRERIDTLFTTTALFNAVVDAVPDCFATIGQVLVGGEQLNAALIRRWYRDNSTARTQLHNVYGPTETTTFALCHPIPQEFSGDLVPIGRPLPDTEALVVVVGTERAAVAGEVGELYLTGAGVAVGYRNLPEETDRRFLRLPWHDGGRERFYRTGDLVRYTADGDIDYVGRVDRQVKVRGFRIEPGEVERQLLAHPGIRHAYACTRRAAAHRPEELLAYLVTEPGLSFEVVDRHLAATVPTYMRPHRLYRVDALPLTANGKVDQAALLSREDRPWRADTATSEVAGWQRAVLDVIGQVLGLPDPRLADRWIACGGDSLAALRFRHLVQRRWGCDISQRLVLQADFAELAAAVDAARGAGSAYSALPASSDAVTAPATSEQQRLWLLQQRSPRSRAYTVAQAFRVDGAVDAEALRRALRALVARHPALRTGFTAAPEGLRQVVGDPYDPWMAPDAVAGRDEHTRRDFIDRFFGVAFDLAQPRMLAACWLAHDGGGILLLRLHHIAVDGWSLGVLFADLSAGYAGELPETRCTAPTPLDFAAWQQEWFASKAYRAQRTELAGYYANVEVANDPLCPVRDRPFAAGRLLHTCLDAERHDRVDRLCADLGLTRFQVLLGVFAWSLYAVTGRTRLRIAAPVANRALSEFESSVGMFANTVLLPLAVRPSAEAVDELRRLGECVREMMDRQDVALADVLADTEFASGAAPFDTLFVLENTDFEALTLPGCTTRPQWFAAAEAKCPLTLSVVERADGTELLWEYAEDHFDDAEVTALADLFRRGLDLVLDNGTAKPSDLAAPYRRGLPETGRGASMPLSFTTVAEGFARQVALTPDAPALESGGRTVSYAELDAFAATLATDIHARHALSIDGLRCVALFFEPSIEHVVALLALARLHLTALPLDPSYPSAVLRQMLEQAEPLCVLLSPSAIPAWDAIDSGEIARHPVMLDTGAAPSDELPCGTDASDGTRPLYMLFTSGSTGRPKGVQVPDRTLCNLLQWQADSGGLGAAAVTQQFAALSFDVSFQEIFSTLCGGGYLHLAQPQWRNDMPALLDQLDSAGAERIFLPYVALQLLAEHGVQSGRYPTRLREIVTAGEQLVSTEAIRRWFAGMPGARLFNQYGPTETHVVSNLCLSGDPMRWPERPAIGRPIDNAVLRVVDEAGQVVPPGAVGELLIGGLMATRCYLGYANADRFVGVPEVGLCYRSGDRVFVDREGLLHFVGRADEQIKVSGHRVELGQIEAALLRYPGLVQAVVVRDGDALVACLQCRDAVPEVTALTAHLARLLPAPVRIDRFRLVAELPRTPSGKLDRRAAASAPGEDLNRTVAAAAWSAREAELAAAFEATTGAPIGSEQTYFDAGATSLALMRFHLHCSTELGLRFTVADLFEYVTIGALARFVDGSTARVAHVARALEVDGSIARVAHIAPASQVDGSTAHTVPASEVDGSIARMAHVAPEVAPADDPIAVVGMAVRLPGAEDLAAFWNMVRTAGRGVEFFDAPTGLVGARSQMAGLLAFDPGHFGINRRDAALMDPQQRHLLMNCVQALAHAGIADPSDRRVGLVAGCGENTYFQTMLREADPALLPDEFQLALHHDKDFLATKVAYHLGLTGPVFTAQAACASSLVAVHLAAGMLRNGEAEVMLAGGVLVDTTLAGGYRYRPQHIFSPDGHCRPFSDDASGTVGASGVGVVVLERLSAARRNGHTVYAVLTGSAVNNDGSAKLGYSAPALAGQREVIRTALRRSGRRGDEVAYVEAHGTGTRLGDPVEVGALRQALGVTESGGCALSSVKSQLGHLGAAAGVIGLIRATLAVHHGLIPPTLDFRAPNPQFGTDLDPFYIPADPRPWPTNRPRVAAVSSFGIGGANAHVVLEAGPDGTLNLESVACLMLSSSSEEALRADAARVAEYLDAHPQTYPQVLRHLQAGRPDRRWRMAAVCPDAAAAVRWLRAGAAVAVDPVSDAVSATLPTAELVAAWLSGRPIAWRPGPAQSPWDFPPPAFDLADYDFSRAKQTMPQLDSIDETGPRRLPEADWLHQPHWVRLRRADIGPASPRNRLLVLMTDGPADPTVVAAFEQTHRRVVQVVADGAGADVIEVVPADSDSLRQVLDVLADTDCDGIDWVHALPLSVDGPVGLGSVARASWACIDTPAALLRAVAEHRVAQRVRVWWLSAQARPVDGVVRRPETNLLAGVCEVGTQESGVPGSWIDLPGTALDEWAAALAELTSGFDGEAAVPKHLALRQGYWWQQLVSPVAAAAAATAPAVAGVYLILGGTGGVGASAADWLLENGADRVVLLARHAQVPKMLAPWADRVETIDADLAESDLDVLLHRIGDRLDRLDGIVHAAGVAAGGLIARRDPEVARRGSAAKLRGALLMERLIQRYRPTVAVYCSSMAARFGGIGQLDYAAANALLDGFTGYRGAADETTQRVSIGWDVWRETGMAVRALPTDARHRAHLAVGLTVAEGQRVFARALGARLPQLLVCTTDLDDARSFYAAPSADATPAGSGVAVESAQRLLRAELCDALGVDDLDLHASLYDLGADSLTMLDLLDTIKQHFGVDLDLARLSHRVSIDEIVTRLVEAAGAAGPEDVVLDVWQEGSGRDVVCLVHPVGGDIQAYRALVSALAPQLTVCLIADPALRQATAPTWTLTERAHHYYAALRTRFPAEEWRWQLAGWSFGAWVAIGMAAEAEAAGQSARVLHLIDPPPPGASALVRAYDEARLHDVLAKELDHAGAAAATAYAERLVRCCRVNLNSMVDHHLPRLANTPSQLWLAEQIGIGDPTSTALQQEWPTHLTAPTRWHWLDTTHYGIVRPPYTQTIAAAINEGAVTRD
ncbi:amino acid adenylation domain-containing protein [Nocardia sp. NBC_01499]|uniref:amino acid adenylation domain-containing protein n=1 Tax=Nocardia sp. NBC_01499 TaxID=2903597 RepID=UPI0038687AF4